MQVIARNGIWSLTSSFGLTLREGSVPYRANAEGMMHGLRLLKNGEVDTSATIYLVPTGTANTVSLPDFWGDWIGEPNNRGNDWSLRGFWGEAGFALNNDDFAEGDETFQLLIYKDRANPVFGDAPFMRVTITIQDDDINGTAGHDTLQGTKFDDYLRGYAGNDLLRGGAGNDYLMGQNGNDTLFGDLGNDTLDGGAGDDLMNGGRGDDTYIVNSIRDRIEEGTNGGRDLVKSSVTYALAANVEDLALTGSGNINATGNGAANKLTGNAGDNTLDGRQGADTMIGGKGNDTYIVDHIGDVVRENANQGNDLVRASVSYALSGNVEKLTLTGTANLNATGNAAANVLTGNAGNNILDGRQGADTMIGGKGNDTYIVDSARDIVRESANQGTDHVKASVDHQLSANVENLTLTGRAAIGKGNELANSLSGNAANNQLFGNAGNDTLSGGAGNDVLDGGLGRDLLIGGAGADTFVFRSIADSAVARAQSDVIQDFNFRHNDQISLQPIDANTRVGGNQAFTFIEDDAFSNKAGQLRYEKLASQTLIQGDVNGDGKADFSILLTGRFDMEATDFIL
ncbi:calcium-binding protein [Paracoccus caeni]|uniref:Calcium-binding protein n=1 Tax=Paracoccus caeni TaxID=657651 RepID=A0A934SFS2_9RHOB|nr:calcium-binding protein [Paracoccus caeni]MBK4214384.1 calcium-binding protein [Paracoccus caeni]